MPHAFYNSPIGWMKLTSNRTKLESIEFLDGETAPEPNEPPTSKVLKTCIKELDAYFNKQLETFSVAVVERGSDFQRQVMREVQTVPFGQVATYLDIAHKVGDVQAVRAVGSANGRNQIPIIIPCHRIVAQNGQLTSYAWGIWRKKWLLEFERGEKQLDLF